MTGMPAIWSVCPQHPIREYVTKRMFLVRGVCPCARARACVRLFARARARVCALTFLPCDCLAYRYTCRPACARSPPCYSFRQIHDSSCCVVGGWCPTM